MSLKESIKEAILKSMESAMKEPEKIPVCIITPESEIAILKADSEKLLEQYGTQIDEIKEAVNKAHKECWDKIQEICVKQGLLTQEEIDKGIRLHIKNQVLFKDVESE